MPPLVRRTGLFLLNNASPRWQLRCPLSLGMPHSTKWTRRRQGIVLHFLLLYLVARRVQFMRQELYHHRLNGPFKWEQKTVGKVEHCFIALFSCLIFCLNHSPCLSHEIGRLELKSCADSSFTSSKIGRFGRMIGRQRWHIRTIKSGRVQDGTQQSRKTNKKQNILFVV